MVLTGAVYLKIRYTAQETASALTPLTRVERW